MNQSSTASINIRDDISTLRSDASKVIADISNLSRKLQEVSKLKSREVAGEFAERFESQFANVRDRFDHVGQDMQTYGRRVEAHVRAHPYLYLLSTLGVGLMVGKAILNRSK